MDLNYDYGDVVHTHKHIHTKPDSHRQVVEHALREWCHDYFGEEANEKCSELNEIEFHDITDGGQEDLKISDVYLLIKDLQKLNDEYKDISHDPPNIYNIKFQGSKMNLNDNDFNIQIKKANGIFKIYVIVNPAETLDLREDGIYLETGSDIEKLEKKDVYDISVIKKLKQTLRNLDLTKLETKIAKSQEEVELQKKNLKNRLHDKGDRDGVERKLQLMERIKGEKKMELVILVILFIIGIMFGVFCIYTQFRLDI